MSHCLRVAEFSDGDSLVRYAIALCMLHGARSSPRGIPVREVIPPVVLTLLDPHKPFLVSPARKPNYRFGLAEACWILSGSDDAELIASFNRNMMEFSDDGRTMWGAYGPRLMGQLAHVIATLKRDPDTRQAVATTWRPMVAAPETYVKSRDLYYAAGMHDPYRDLENNPHPEWDGASWRSKDVPCTIAWHFQLREDRLQLTVFMRSNDAWLGLPYDLLSFTTVQRVVAAMLGVQPGPYHHVTSNLHLYDKNLKQAQLVIDESAPQSLVTPSMPEFKIGFESLFFHASIRDVTSCFSDLINDVHEHTIEELAPFAAAIKRRPDLSPMYRSLQRAVHRGWPSKGPTG